MKKPNIITVLSMAALLCLLIVMIVQLLPLLRDVISNSEDEASIVAYVNSIGWRGVPALIGLSALQAIIIIVPAPAVGVLTGLSYGIYWGPIIFLSGVALGNLFVVVTVRQLHSLIPSRAKQTAKHKKLLSKEQLEKIKRPELVAFLLAMIPWLSSAGPYLFAETRVSLGKYIIAVVAGNIPSTLLYVFLGDRISRGNYTAAIIIAAIVVIAAAFILVFRKKIMEKIMVERDV